jgi:hypothetical protein
LAKGQTAKACTPKTIAFEAFFYTQAGPGPGPAAPIGEVVSIHAALVQLQLQTFAKIVAGILALL